MSSIFVVQDKHKRRAKYYKAVGLMRGLLLRDVLGVHRDEVVSNDSDHGEETKRVGEG